MMKNLQRFAVAALTALALWTAPALAAQDSCILPTSGTVSGLTLVQDINTCNGAMLSLQSGATAPSTPTTGMLWRDTSVTPQLVKQYDGANWSVVWALDTSGHLIVPPIGGGSIDNVASGTITDLWAKPQAALTVSGVTAVTQFANASAPTGSLKVVKFTGVMLLTYDGTKLILPSGQNITTAVGDYAVVLALTNTNVAVVSYTRADGTAVNQSSNFLGAVFFNSPGTFTLASDTNNWSPAGFATQNVLRLTCSAALKVTGLLAPATDGKIVVIDNVGATNNCTFTTQDASSTAGNRFAFDRPIAVRPGRSLTVKYDITAARWRMWQEVTSQPIMGGFKNLRVFNVATALGDTAPGTPNSQMKIVVDQITLEDINGGAVRLSNVTCTVSASGNSFGAGAGGLDTGSLTVNNWYSFWVIYAPTTDTTSCLASLRTLAYGTPGVDAITLPATYTHAARVGWNYYLTFNSVTGFQRLIQYNRRAQYSQQGSTPTPKWPVVATGGNSSTMTSYSIATIVPPTAVMLRAMLFINSSNSAFLNSNGTSAFGGTDNLICGAFNSANSSLFTCDIQLETMNLWYGATSSVNADAVGWEDNL